MLLSVSQIAFEMIISLKNWNCLWLFPCWLHIYHCFYTTRIRSIVCILFWADPWFRDSMIPTSFPLNILRINLWKLDQILHMHWRWPDLDWHCYELLIFANIQHSYGPWLVSQFRFRSIQYLVNELMEFDQMFANESDLGWVFYRQFLPISNRVMALDFHQNFVPAQYL